MDGRYAISWQARLSMQLQWRIITAHRRSSRALPTFSRPQNTSKLLDRRHNRIRRSLPSKIQYAPDCFFQFWIVDPGKFTPINKFGFKSSCIVTIQIKSVILMCERDPCHVVVCIEPLVIINLVVEHPQTALCRPRLQTVDCISCCRACSDIPP